MTVHVHTMAIQKNLVQSKRGLTSSPHKKMIHSTPTRVYMFQNALKANIRAFNGKTNEPP